MYAFILVTLGALLCSLQAMRATRLLTSSLWLAGTSALTALLLYMLGAPQAAVVELSVGAGLVTVLFVFAISMAGEEVAPLRSVVPVPVVSLLVVAAVGLLLWMLWPVQPPAVSAAAEAPFAEVVWQARALDMLLQVVLIFAGVLGLLGLLAGEQAPVSAGQFRFLTRATSPTAAASSNGRVADAERPVTAEEVGR